MLPPAMVAVPASSSVIVTVRAVAGFNVTPILLPAASPSASTSSTGTLKLTGSVRTEAVPKPVMINGLPDT